MKSKDKKIITNNKKIKDKIHSMGHIMRGNLKCYQTVSSKIQENLKIVCKISTHWIQLEK